jgi:hypothetical protein
MMNLQNQYGSNGGEAYVNDFNDLSTYIPYENQNFGPRYNGKNGSCGQAVQMECINGSLCCGSGSKAGFFKRALPYRTA